MDGVRTLKGGVAEIVSIECDGPGCPHAGDEGTTRVDPLAGWIRSTIRQRPPASGDASS